MDKLRNDQMRTAMLNDIHGTGLLAVSEGSAGPIEGYFRASTQDRAALEDLVSGERLARFRGTLFNNGKIQDVTGEVRVYNHDLHATLVKIELISNVGLDFYDVD